jgi:hypothetical protein
MRFCSIRSRTLVFTLFAVAMLYSIVREWSAPVACPRLPVTRNVARTDFPHR